MEELEIFQRKRKAYNELQCEILRLEVCIVRTSYGNDGNGDANWDDENAQPISMIGGISL